MTDLSLWQTPAQEHAEQQARRRRIVLIGAVAFAAGVNVAVWSIAVLQLFR